MPDIEIDEMSTRMSVADQQATLDPAVVQQLVEEVTDRVLGERVAPDIDPALLEEGGGAEWRARHAEGAGGTAVDSSGDIVTFGADGSVETTLADGTTSTALPVDQD